MALPGNRDDLIMTDVCSGTLRQRSTTPSRSSWATEFNPTIPAVMSEPRMSRPSAQSQTEPKARGANRSTKVAGKLKVLPEQPDNLPGFRPQAVTLQTEHIKDYAEATGDSDEADIDEDDDQQDEEIEVNSILPSASVLLIFCET